MSARNESSCLSVPPEVLDIEFSQNWNARWIVGVVQTYEVAGSIHCFFRKWPRHGRQENGLETLKVSQNNRWRREVHQNPRQGCPGKARRQRGFFRKWPQDRHPESLWLQSAPDAGESAQLALRGRGRAWGTGAQKPRDLRCQYRDLLGTRARGTIDLCRSHVFVFFLLFLLLFPFIPCSLVSLFPFFLFSLFVFPIFPCLSFCFFFLSFSMFPLFSLFPFLLFLLFSSAFFVLPFPFSPSHPFFALCHLFFSAPLSIRALGRCQVAECCFGFSHLSDPLSYHQHQPEPGLIPFSKVFLSPHALAPAIHVALFPALYLLLLASARATSTSTSPSPSPSSCPNLSLFTSSHLLMLLLAPPPSPHLPPPSRLLKQTTFFDVSLHLHAIFKMSFEIRCCICLQPCPRLQHVYL